MMDGTLLQDFEQLLGVPQTFAGEVVIYTLTSLIIVVGMMIGLIVFDMFIFKIGD